MADSPKAPYQRGAVNFTAAPTLLLVATAAALAFGLYGRFIGLGKWPFGVDEFYISRSIDNVLRTGLPHFACGGFYTRGLSYQYLVALLRLWGQPPELSARLVSAISSLVGLPAAYIVGRRLAGRAFGLLMLIVLSLSVWEIEMARFARMYAAYQSIFLWYLVFLLRYTVDRDRSALWPMITLSVIGTLTWEGGALLGLTNLLPVLFREQRGQLRRSDWGYVGGMLLLFVALLLATTDFRGPSPFGGGSQPESHLDAFAAIRGSLAAYTTHPWWMLAWLILVAVLGVPAAIWVWSLRNRWLAATAPGAALAAAALHQFALGVACIAIVSLVGLVQPREWKARGAQRFLLCVGALALFWFAFGISSGAWREIDATSSAAAARWFGLAEHWLGFPHVFAEILRPWGRTMPFLTLGICLLSGWLVLRVSLRPPHEVVAVRVLLVLVLVLMLAVGAREPGRIETRYTFFLYPLVIMLSFLGIIELLRDKLETGPGIAAGVALGLLFFGVTEDFRPIHVARIDSRAVSLRLGMSPVLADHYYPHSDYRVLAAWLAQNTRASDVVVIGIPSVDQYYHGASYFFLRDDDQRYDSYACGAYPVERWTNLSLLYRTGSLEPLISGGRRIVLILYPDQVQALMADGRDRHWRERLAWTAPDDGSAVMLINPTGG